MAPPEGSSELVVKTVSGSHVFTVNGYSHTKGVVYGDFITAATFAATGHRWSILYYPNGSCDNNRDYISLYLKIDPSSTSGPDVVKARFRFSLLGKDGEPVPGYSKSSDDISYHQFLATMNDKLGIQKFIGRSSLEKSGCLVDDRFSIRCDITVLKVIRKEGLPGERFVVVPPSSIDKDIGNLLSIGKGADIMFEVDGETFAAHRSILAARSPVFMAELFSPVKEKAAASVRVDDMEARVFEALLHFVYTDSVPETDQGETMVMAQHLLVAAERYSLARLKLICEDKLCNYIDTSTVGTILTLAEQHGCHGLKKACFQFLMSGNSLNAALETDGFEHLTKSCPLILKDLLRKISI